MILPNWFFFLLGDPQEECVRCGKMFLATGNGVALGICDSCSGRPQTNKLHDNETDTEEGSVSSPSPQPEQDDE